MMILSWNRKTICLGMTGLFLTLFCFLVEAQTEYTIRGSVGDESGQAVAFANITIKDITDSSLVGGTITGETGKFSFRLQQPGTYQLTASFVGYETRDTILRPIDAADANSFHILLHREHTILDEVVIRKQRNRAKQQVDLTTYYVNSNMRSAAETGVELVRQVPGVSVDLMNTISLNGSKQVKILVNGMERDADYLGQLDAGRIDRIDIRTNGSLQYDAGVSGVINVVLKEEPQEGFSGHVYANVPARADEVFSFPSASLNYSRKNTTWYTSYNGSFSNFNIEGTNHKTFAAGHRSREISRTDSLRQNNWSHKLHFGVDHFSNKKNQLSFYGFFSGFSNEQDGQFLLVENSEYTGKKSFHMKKDDLDKNRSVYGSMYVQHRFNPSSVLTLEGNAYLRRSETGLVLTNPESGVRQVSLSEPKTNKINVRTHFSSNISERTSIASGIEQQYTHLEDYLLPSFNYSKRVFSGFIRGAFNGKRFQIQGGIRAEYSRTIYSDMQDKKQLFLLPQVDLKYDINSKNNIRISYGKQINQPQLHQLNPNLYTIDPFTLQQGNPRLTPEIIRNLSAMYNLSFQENYLSGGIFYRKLNGLIENLTTLTDAGILRMEQQNLGDLKYAGVKVLGSVDLFDNVSMGSNIECFHVQTRVNVTGQQQGIAEQSRLEIRGEMSAVWNVYEDLSLSASLRFQSSATGIQRQYQEGTLYFISLEKVFFNRLKAEITSAIPFKRSFVYQGYNIANDDFAVSSKDQIKMSMVPVWFKLKYSFASGSKVRHLERDEVFKEKREKKGF